VFGVIDVQCVARSKNTRLLNLLILLLMFHLTHFSACSGSAYAV